jgi:phosphoribosyl 1,2-cyclic phosphate phosphodiesterase
MKVTFLGTGTSVGIPVIGCECRVCTSADPRNRRLRTSLYVEAAGVHVVVDTSLDFREQALAYRIPRVDAIFITHSHADHIFGLDDVRRYNTIQGGGVPVFGSPATIGDLRRIFAYVSATPTPKGVFRPRLDFRSLESAVEIGGVRVEPLRVLHGESETYGYRLNAEGRSLGYVPDCHEMPEESLERLRGVNVMVLDALRHRPHPTHLTVADSAALLRRIAAGRSLMTHLCHDIEHAETQAGLPQGIELAYDGLSLTV